VADRLIVHNNPYLESYKFKRKLDTNYFRLIDQKFPEKNVCYFCLTVEGTDASIDCKIYCKQQLEFRNGHKPIRDAVLERDNFTCQMCGVEERYLSQALKILKKTNKKLWKLKLEELHIPEKRAGCLLDMDHILPVSKGGGAGIDIDIRLNLWILCIFCHFHKDYCLNGPTVKPAKSKTKDREVL